MKKVVGHYEIIQKIGRGGMGVVYKARDVRLDRIVALKMLPEERLENGQRQRLVREARTASALNHPNIVTIYDIDMIDGKQIVAMEFVPGRSLAEMVRVEGLPVADVLGYAAQIAEAASKAHAAGIVHRDLKPANIMVTNDGLVKVLDFGLAKKYAVDENQTDSRTLPAPLTKPGLVIGTVAYMSPEQALGEDIDARSDIFALGIILYELLSGVRPFVGNTTLATLHKIQVAVPSPLTGFRSDVPQFVEKIVRKALEKDKTERYQTMQELRADLLAALANPARKGWNRKRLERKHLTAIAAALILLGIIVVSIAEFESIRNWLPQIRIARAPTALVDPSTQPASAMNAAGWTSQAVSWLDRYDRAGNADRSIAAAKKALERDASHAMAYAVLAKAYSLKNGAAPDPQLLRNATESARKAIELSPELGAAHMASGIVLLNMHDMAQAARTLERAHELDPLHGETCMWLAEYYFQTNDFPRAEDFYKQALQLNPKDWPIYGRYGTFLYKNARYADAVTVWEQGRTLTPDNVIILKNLGAAYHMLNKYEDASAAFQRALEVQPTAAVYSNLGTARFFQGRYDQSAAAFEKAVDMNPNSFLYWGNLGDARRQAAGQAGKARDAYLQAIRLVQEKLAATPDDPELAGNLSVYYAKAGDHQHALEAAAQLEKIGTRTAGSYFKALLAYEISGSRDKALQSLALALRSGYSLQEIKNEPDLTSLRTDRRYHEIVTK